jgi:hypothetical protein
MGQYFIYQQGWHFLPYDVPRNFRDGFGGLHGGSPFDGHKKTRRSGWKGGREGAKLGMVRMNAV